MPPTKHKTGDIFFAHVHDAMFNLVGITTHQSIELLGMFSEADPQPAPHGPLPRRSRRRATSTRACRHLGDEIEFKPDGIVASRAVQVLDEALALLEEVKRDSIWEAIAPRRVRRREAHADGRQGVRAAWSSGTKDYVNPILDALEAEYPESEKRVQITVILSAAKDPTCCAGRVAAFGLRMTAIKRCESRTQVVY